MGSALAPVAPWSRPQGGGSGSMAMDPFKMMGDVMNLRQSQQEWNSRAEAGQIIATSPDMDTAMQRMRDSPNSAWMLPQMQSIREQQLTEANIGQAKAGAQRTRFETGREGAEWAIRMSPDGQALQTNLDSVLHGLDPATQAEVGGMYGDIKAGIGTGPDARQKMIGLMIRSGMSPAEAYGAYGKVAPWQEYREIPGPKGGVTPTVVSGGGLGEEATPGGGTPGGTPTGTGAGAPGAPMQTSLGVPTPGLTPLTPPTATTVQMQQAKDLQETKNSLDANVSSGNTVMQSVNKAEELMSHFDTSSLSDRRSVLAGLAQAIGADPSFVNNLSGGDLASMQEFSKYLYTLANQRLSGSQPPGGKLNIMETEAWLGANPTINMQKKAVADIFDGLRRSQITNIIQQRELNKFMQTNAQVPGAEGMWSSHWQTQQQRMGLNEPHYYVPGSTTKAIPPSVIMDLLANDTPANRQSVDKKYGPGVAERFLEDQ